MQVNWRGVFPAVTTKFTDDDRLDLDAFRKNIDAQLEAGVDGIILGGTLGEASVLSADEKSELVRACVAHVDGRVPVIMNVAEQTTANAIAAAAKAQEDGASGLMMLPPMRYKADHRETVAYYKAVAESTELPIMVYNNPVDYGIEVTIDMFRELADSPNIQAVKESTRDISNVTRMKNEFGDRFAILSGVDTLALEEIFMGADGWVAGLVCAFPKETVTIFRLAKAGRPDEALAIYRWFLPLLELDIHPKLVQYIKLAEVATGIGTENVRAPRLPLEGEERERILKIINDGVAARPELPEVESPFSVEA
ncbi:dihydrodipicolinate synthase family protein [Aureibacter tunicatorum]|uniref:4-hydroxy-tetrahydrodipicolinate synthase n=1 Tax=Aureibacter tunicatorum TaxID=866807 RepID=A0AAE3XKS6_9BACT|nr:dihydrodipicolinate synthase family protein [Aureibacter tunicatorum]MDR6237818.1 4-hydroxy-tetrahydrodipicolinate synthase [Aureibacter tunicatorum]BDD02853.1 dihydrodipicolinate synthase family protein [Aureibacter tunicatorum]